MLGILGKKVGMTSVFDANQGKQVACTVVSVGACVVTQVKNKANDGYDAIQIGYQDKKNKRINKAEEGRFSKIGVPVKQFLCELRGQYDKSVGDVLDATLFVEGDVVEVVGKTKGRGFQGVIKRHGFRGVGEASHGQHDRQRAPGSVGGSSFPSRVFKGLRMAGRMGGDRVKIKGLVVLKVFAEQGLVLLSGAIPGAKDSLVLVQKP